MWLQTLMWVTIASVAIYLAYNTAGMYVTEELGAVTRTVRCAVHMCLLLSRDCTKSTCLAYNNAGMSTNFKTQNSKKVKI